MLVAFGTLFLTDSDERLIVVKMFQSLDNEQALLGDEPDYEAPFR